VLASFAGNWLLPRLADFEAKHPAIAVELRATTDYADFERDDVDAAIRFGTGPWAGLANEALLSLRVFAVCSPAVAAAVRVPADLASQRLLHESHVADAWSGYLAAAGVPALVPAAERTLDNAQLLLEAAAAGQGVALSTPVLAHRLLSEGKLVRPLDVVTESPRTYHFVWRPGDERRTSVRAFRDWLFAAMHEFEAVNRDSPCF
jgi:DNA-binding transcriptional LysR family regulator